MLDSVSSFGDPATQSSASGFLPSPGRYTALPAPTAGKEEEEPEGLLRDAAGC